MPAPFGPGITTYGSTIAVADGSGTTSPPVDLTLAVMALLTEMRVMNTLLVEIFNPPTDLESLRADPDVISFQNLPLS